MTDDRIGREFEWADPNGRTFVANIRIVEVGYTEFWVENVMTGARRAIDICDFDREWQPYAPIPKADEIWNHVPPKLGAVRVLHVVDDWVLYSLSDSYEYERKPLQARRVDDFTSRFERLPL